MTISTCSQAVVQAAHDAGACVVFANPGTTEMWLVSALAGHPGMRSILGLHEAVCSGACDGYARMARTPALCLLHLGPGLANALCNLHNARRARVPIVVLVGEMSTWHRDADPLLNMDIKALADTVSCSTTYVMAADKAPAAMRAVIDAAMCPKPVDSSYVSTIILPHDLSWTDVSPTLPASAAAPTSPKAAAAASSTATAAGGGGAAAGYLHHQPQQHGYVDVSSSPAAQQFIKDCAAALKRAPRGKAALLLGGQALLAGGDALPAAGRIAAHLGTALLCDSLPTRVDRGEGLPLVQRLPYFPQEATQELSKYETVLLVDVRRPVAMFGYKDGPSQLLPQDDDHIWEVDHSLAAPDVLRMLCAELGADVIKPGVNCMGRFVTAAARPQLPTGKLTADALCRAVAALQPPGCVLVDEALTSGFGYWEAAKACPSYTFMTVTGGSIGNGPPMALGAAIAAPDRTIINLQADGSGMYTLQALWTQARERTNVITIICDNGAYNILKVENMRQRVPGTANPITNSLTSLQDPPLDWVALAKGMGVRGSRAETAEQVCEQLQAALADPSGPRLIQAVLST